MKHLKGFRKLSRTHSHRKALYKNMVTSLFKKERIKTTTIKAKEIRKIAEKLITRAKEKTVHNLRIVNKLIKDKKILLKLFNEIAPRYKTRNGGYTRIIKLGIRRKGDGAELAYLELVEERDLSSKKNKKKDSLEKKIEKNEQKNKEIQEKKDETQNINNQQENKTENKIENKENKITEEKKSDQTNEEKK